MIVIERAYFKDCTIGRLEVEGMRCFTLELPFLDNKKSISSIPEGKYKAFRRVSPKNGLVIELMDVPNRTNIQIHAGNYTRQIEGCILVGKSITYLDSDSIPDVTNSKDTLLALLKRLPTDAFEIEIK